MKLAMPHSPLVNPTQRLAGIERARHALLLGRARLPAGGIAPWIERSWQRCMNLGLRPQERVAFELASEQHRRRTNEANRRLVQTAKPILETLGRAIVNTGYFAILTNAQGVVVDVSGPIDHSDPRASAITRIGTDLSESSIGTSAIGATLAELQPVWLHRGEHFFEDTSVYSCAGAPLFGADGSCVGMLDLTGIEAIERPELKHLVTQSACKIENALVLEQSHSLMVRLNWPGNAMGSETDGIVCLDADGWITGANQVARQMVPNFASAAGPNLHISDVFGAPYELLFDAVRQRDATLEIPLWTGLRLKVLPIERSREALPVQSGPLRRTADHLPLKDIELSLIRSAVDQARGNVAQAARTLGVSRATVYRKLGQRAPSGTLKKTSPP